MYELPFSTINAVTSIGSSVLNITYNVVGGILTIVATGLFVSLRKKWHRRRFQHVFGTGDERYQLVYAPLKLHPDVKAAVPAPFLNPHEEPFVFVRRDSDNARFSARQITSSCEIRAASYVASALGKDGDRESSFVDDESLASKLDMDFVSFGLTSNKKTIDVLNNAANDLVVLDFNQGFFAWKWTGKPLYDGRRAGFDYGLILKIQPTQFPERTWIACGGLDETGTTGAAWFLARNWRQLEERAGGKGHFFALVEVEPGIDESALLVSFGKTPARAQ